MMLPYEEMMIMRYIMILVLLLALTQSIGCSGVQISGAITVNSGSTSGTIFLNR
jgi:hydrogenase/urease accessory protein HupE